MCVETADGPTSSQNSRRPNLIATGHYYEVNRMPLNGLFSIRHAGVFCIIEIPKVANRNSPPSTEDFYLQKWGFLSCIKQVLQNLRVSLYLPIIEGDTRPGQYPNRLFFFTIDGIKY